MITRVAIAFTLPGNIPVYFFSLLISAGAVVGLGRLLLFDDTGRLLASGFIILFTGLTGARIVSAVVHPGNSLLQLPIGGLSWAGALAGSAAGIAVASRFRGLSFLSLADRVLTLGAAISFAAWLGCWVDGCAYGAPASTGLAVPARDEWGNISNRYPLQLIGALLAFLTLALADLIQARAGVRGAAAGSWMTLTGAQLAFLQSLRADPSPLWQGIRPEVWGAWMAVGAGILLLTYALLKKNHPMSD